MEDLPIGSEIVLKVVETKEVHCTGCFFDEISSVSQSTEKTESLFNLKE